MEKMQSLFSFLTRNLVSILGVTVLTGATVATSAVGIAKVGQSMATTHLDVPEAREVSSSSSVSSVSSNAQKAASSVSAPNSGNSSSGRSSFVNQQVANSSSSSQSSTSNACIITLFGKQYDVTSLQGTHPGGNVFVCGTDQTALYQGQHGTDVSRMQPYLYTGGATSSTNSSQQSSANSSVQNGSRHEDDRSEDRQEEREHEQEREHEEEYEGLESMIKAVRLWLHS